MQKEQEQLEYIQSVFLIQCALRNWSSDKIDDVVYKIESIRREVIK